jgi:alpha-1,3-rhamnosyl/mannosyltransferase
MRVLVSEIPTFGAKTGIGHYTQELIRCLREQAGTDQIAGFAPPWIASERIKRILAPDRGAKASASLSQLPPTLKHKLRAAARAFLGSFNGRLTALWFRACWELGNYQLYHEPNFIPVASNVDTVATIHDLSALLHPEWHPIARVRRFEREFERGLRRCRHFFAISESARQEIIRTCHIPPERITRTYMGVRRDLKPMPRHHVDLVLKKLGLPHQFLLHVGTIEPRKNVHMLLRAYCALPAALRERYPLVLVGRWGWNMDDALRFYHDEARPRGVLHLGYVPDEHIAALYNGARALLFPTFYEGFGIPPIEMMACGGAVIASTAAAVRETVGAQAHLVDPLDEEAWTRALRLAIEDDDWWLALRAGATSVAARYTWDQCAADTLRVYRSLCGRGEPQSGPEPAAAPYGERRAA